MHLHLFLLLGVTSATPAAAQEDAALVRARALLKRTLLVDGHNDLPWAIRESPTAPADVEAYDLRTRTRGATDLERLAAGRVSAQLWSVYVPGEDPSIGYARTQLEQLDLARRVIQRYPQRLALALSADDVQRAFAAGKVASLLAMEGGHAIENSLGALRAFHALGVRSMGLTHNTTLAWADSGQDAARHDGLTAFGEAVVAEMNWLGMLVDLSHSAPATALDALRVSQAPVIFSHSNARALCDVPRNVPDEVLARVRPNGGIVMVTFVAPFVSQAVADVALPLWRRLDERTKGLPPAEKARVADELMASVTLPKATVAQVADHIEHIRTVAGVDHLGLGGDFDGNTLTPVGLEDVSTYPVLFAELVRRGWSDADLAKLAGGNFLRVLRAAEATAKRLRAARPASTVTLEALDRPDAGR